MIPASDPSCLSSSPSPCFSSQDSPAESSISSVDSSPDISCKEQQPHIPPQQLTSLIKQSTTQPKQQQQTPQPPILIPSKSTFIEALVNSSTLIIEAIWSFSTESQCYIHRAMPLHRFVYETLRRARTSYSTLQLTLYYLILIKPYVFKAREHNRRHGIEVPSGTSPQLRCGRRAFLAALMLASKYSQDRNYSASAWSKISGLGVKELSDNELLFLKAVNWNLFVDYSVYERWSQVLFECASDNDENSLDGVRRAAWVDRFRNMDTKVSQTLWNPPACSQNIPKTLLSKKRGLASVDGDYDGDDETERVKGSYTTCTQCSAKANRVPASTASVSTPDSVLALNLRTKEPVGVTVTRKGSNSATVATGKEEPNLGAFPSSGVTEQDRKRLKINHLLNPDLSTSNLNPRHDELVKPKDNNHVYSATSNCITVAR